MVSPDLSQLFDRLWGPNSPLILDLQGHGLGCRAVLQRMVNGHLMQCDLTPFVRDVDPLHGTALMKAHGLMRLLGDVTFGVGHITLVLKHVRIDDRKNKKRSSRMRRLLENPHARHYDFPAFQRVLLIYYPRVKKFTGNIP